jgi:hypothetical protein
MTQGRRRQCLVAALLGVVSLGTLSAAAPVRAAAPARQTERTDARGPLAGRLDGVPFDQALATLARALPVPITIRGSVGREPVSIALDGISVESALRQLLRGRSYVAVYGEDAANPGVPRLAEIIVLGEPGAGGQDVEREASPTTPMPASMPAPPMKRIRTSPPRDERELHHLARRGATAGERRGALTALAHRRPGRDTTALLAAALDDPDEQVRAVALRHLAALPDAPPAAAVARVAREDTSPHLRRRALDLLALAPSRESERELHRALTDPDPGVREHAERLLQDPLNAVRPSRSEAP